MGQESKRHDRKRWAIALASLALVGVVLIAGYPIAKSRVTGHILQTSLSETDSNNAFATQVSYGGFLGLGGISEVTITRRSTEDTNPIVRVENLNVSPEWSALVRGQLAVDIYMGTVAVNLLRDDFATMTETLDEEEGRRILETLREVPVSDLTIDSAYATFFDGEQDPPVQLQLVEMSITARDMADIPNREEESSFELLAETAGGGEADAFASVLLFADEPEIWAEITVDDVSLAELGHAIEAYTSVAIEEGSFNAASRLQLDNQHLTGFVRQAIRDLEMESLESPGDIFSLQTLALVYKNLRDDEDGNFEGTSEFNVDLNELEGGRVRSTVDVLKDSFIATFDLQEEERLQTEEVAGS